MKSTTTTTSIAKLKNALLWILAPSTIVLFVNASVPIRHCGGTPRHVTIAVGPDPFTQMIVSFASIPSKYPAPIGGVIVSKSASDLEDYNTATKDGAIFVEDSDSPTSYNLTVRKTQANYGDRYYSPYYHHITIDNLEPETTYYYKPVVHTQLHGFNRYKKHLRDATGKITKLLTESEMLKALKEADAVLGRTGEGEIEYTEEDGFRQRRNLIQWPPYDGSHHDCPSPDKIRSFTTAPLPGKPVNFAIIGDLGQFPHSEDTASRLLRSRDEIDTVILAGDIGYTTYDHNRWDTFFDFMDDFSLADHVPMQICPGNHDIDKIKDDDNIFLAYEHRFRMPRVHPPKLGVFDGPKDLMNMDAPPYPLPYEWGNAYYSYTYSSARVIMISAYSSMEPNSTQYQWISDELEAVDRTKTPWVIAVIHTPIYNTFGVHHHDPQIFAAREHLEPLFVKHNVNFVFTGHIHAYMRTAAVIHEEPEETGPIHITVGAGGRNCQAPFQNEEPEPWVAVRDATYYGYGMFRIFNATHAEWEWIHTGHAEDRTENELYHSNVTLPGGPAMDRVVFENQYAIKQRRRLQSSNE